MGMNPKKAPGVVREAEKKDDDTTTNLNKGSRKAPFSIDSGTHLAYPILVSDENSNAKEHVMKIAEINKFGKLVIAFINTEVAADAYRVMTKHFPNNPLADIYVSDAKLNYMCPEGVTPETCLLDLEGGHAYVQDWEEARGQIIPLGNRRTPKTKVRTEGQCSLF
jgi:hypothetical protein